MDGNVYFCAVVRRTKRYKRDSRTHAWCITMWTPCPTLCEKRVGSFTSQRVCGHWGVRRNLWLIFSIREDIAISRSRYRGSTFFQQLKTLGVDPAGVSEPTTSRTSVHSLCTDLRQNYSAESSVNQPSYWRYQCPSVAFWMAGFLFFLPLCSSGKRKFQWPLCHFTCWLRGSILY